MPDFRQAAHLPHNRPDGMPSDPRDLPRQRRGTTPQMHGRYPDYDVLSQARHWDEATRRVVMRRVRETPPIRFFANEEIPTLRAFLDTVLAQDAEPRIPVLEMVDAKMHARRFDGWRYAGMPDDAQVWKVVAAGLDEAAGGCFAACDADERLEICGAFSRGELGGGAWERVDVRRAWSVVMRIALAQFYSHPWAWNEIGFGGPAYPRGYARLGVGMGESWEGTPQFDLDPVRDVRARGLEGG
ncbi:MAG TPA: gluconate 2-dehydrogenase subunit 3 family protein [Conexibacter sp.]|nr:gluconate 2-dehydrogenase subunit 3 family protein [Conexibacter sp.]